MFQASFLTIKHAIVTEMGPGMKNEFFTQLLKEGWLEAFSCMAFHTVKKSLLLPCNQLSPCINTPAHICWRWCFSNFFSLDSVICPHFLKGEWGHRQSTSQELTCAEQAGRMPLQAQSLALIFTKLNLPTPNFHKLSRWFWLLICSSI